MRGVRRVCFLAFLALFAGCATASSALDGGTLRFFKLVGGRASTRLIPRGLQTVISLMVHAPLVAFAAATG